LWSPARQRRLIGQIAKADQSAIGGEEIAPYRYRIHIIL
jgi:hypothetical protein